MSFNNILHMVSAKKKQNTTAMNTTGVYISNMPQKKGGSCLLIIDPQVDFVAEDGALSVPGAIKDCENIAQFIRDNLDDLQAIYVTLDSHMSFHIAHPNFWRKKGTGELPDPFVTISHQQVMDGEWVPAEKDMLPWAKEYTHALESKPRLKGLDAFQLTIWPPHCLIGHPGHNVHPIVLAALKEWEATDNRVVNYVMKGNNSLTEHYSAFRAEVIIEKDPGTHFNENLFRDLSQHNTIFVCGEAKSHCVNFTVRDLVDKLTPEKAIDKVVLLDGGMSCVIGCEKMGEAFENDMKSLTEKRGLKIRNLNTERVKALGNGLTRRSVATNAGKKIDV